MTEYGLWSDIAGLIEAGFWSIEKAATALADYVSLDADNAEDLSVVEICPDHDGQVKGGCEYCDDESWEVA
jgi:hypothetical protein